MLSSWKEIAHFFGKGVRTVQRWEKTLDLPIHRPPGAPSNVVLARTSDLEEWMHRGPVSRAAASTGAQPANDGVEAVLSRLEQEIHDLSETLGVHKLEQDPSRSTPERIQMLTAEVSRISIKLAPGEAARAA